MSDDPREWAIVVAAGAATRYGRPKQFDDLGGVRVLDRSVRACVDAGLSVVVVMASEYLGEAPASAERVVAGGASRSASVRAGLAAVPAAATTVMVHDGARPLASAAVFARVRSALADGADAAVPGVAITDSIRHLLHGPIDRTDLVAVQTPQGFAAAALRAAHAEGPDAFDDATLISDRGGRVVVVEGDVRNIKLTVADDLAVAEALLALGSAE